MSGGMQAGLSFNVHHPFLSAGPHSHAGPWAASHDQLCPVPSPTVPHAPATLPNALVPPTMSSLLSRIPGHPGLSRPVLPSPSQGALWGQPLPPRSLEEGGEYTPFPHRRRLCLWPPPTWTPLFPSPQNSPCSPPSLPKTLPLLGALSGSPKVPKSYLCWEGEACLYHSGCPGPSRVPGKDRGCHGVDSACCPRVATRVLRRVYSQAELYLDPSFWD